MNRKAIAATLVIASMAIAASAPPDKTHMDTSGVRKVVISGSASSLRLTAGETAPYRASVRSRRKGWFARWYTNWFFNGCASAGLMRVEDNVLLVDVPSAGGFDFDDCIVEIEASIPSGTSVTIGHKAVKASLSGSYGAISLRSHAADFSFDGTAGSVDLISEALRANADFSGGSVETLSIAGEALDASLDFAEGASVSYDIEATASFIDSTIENDPRGDTSVQIKGRFVRATIR